MSQSRTILCVVITLICIAVGVWAGVTLTALRITGKPQLFRSLAKVVAGGHMASSGMLAEEHLNDFYGTIIETLESPEMSRKARERVHSLHPDLKDSDVEVAVRQTKGSGIINILVSGSEPKYTQIFLNALLDEFIAFRQIIREQAQGKVLSTFLQEVVNKQKAMEAALGELQAAGTEGKSILARIELERFDARFKSLSNERDDLKLTLRGNPADAAEKTTRLTALEDEVERIGEEVIRQEAAGTRLRVATERHAAAKTAYEEMFKRAENFQAMFNANSEYVAIQERATSAAEHTDDWKMPILTGGVVGAALGLLAGLLISLFIGMLGRSNAPQAPA